MQFTSFFKVCYLTSSYMQIRWLEFYDSGYHWLDHYESVIYIEGPQTILMSIHPSPSRTHSLWLSIPPLICPFDYIHQAPLTLHHCLKLTCKHNMTMHCMASIFKIPDGTCTLQTNSAKLGFHTPALVHVILTGKSPSSHTRSTVYLPQLYQHLIPR